MAGVTISPSPTYLTATAINLSSTGSNTIVAGATGLKVRVYRLLLTTQAATTVTFQDGSSNLTGAIGLGANGAIVLDNTGDPWFQTGTGNTFALTQSATATITGAIWYTQTTPLGG